MKSFFKAYLQYTRTERMGIVALLLILIVLIAVKASMHLWVSPQVDTTKEKELAAKWEQAKKSGSTVTMPQHAFEPPGTSATLFKFDPNTIDAAGLKKLGLKDKTISIFLNWRSKGKVFHSKEEFKKLYTLTPDEYERLVPYIIIDNPKNIKQPKLVNLNTADSAELVALPGIGAKLAHRILEYRKEIGRYTSADQLMEVYRFPDTTFRRLKQLITVK
jgi:competence ComEA-like helix-hairpin-helix protein